MIGGRRGWSETEAESANYGVVSLSCVRKNALKKRKRKRKSKTNCLDVMAARVIGLRPPSREKATGDYFTSSDSSSPLLFSSSLSLCIVSGQPPHLYSLN